MAARATWATSSTAIVMEVHDGIDDLAGDLEDILIAAGSKAQRVRKSQRKRSKMHDQILQERRKASVVQDVLKRSSILGNHLRRCELSSPSHLGVRQDCGLEYLTAMCVEIQGRNSNRINKVEPRS